MREKKKFKSTKIFQYRSLNQQKKKDIKYPLSFNLEKQELKI